jgi:hypothetical protein
MLRKQFTLGFDMEIIIATARGRSHVEPRTELTHAPLLGRVVVRVARNSKNAADLGGANNVVVQKAIEI